MNYFKYMKIGFGLRELSDFIIPSKFEHINMFWQHYNKNKKTTYLTSIPDHASAAIA